MALVGESGSGKSVTAYAIMGYSILRRASRRVRSCSAGWSYCGRGKSDRRDPRARIGDHLSKPAQRAQPDPTVGRQIADILLRHGNVTAAGARACH
jgi:ABC-type glutathione transport system ATPase component